VTQIERHAPFPLPLVGRGGAEGAGVGIVYDRVTRMPHSAITKRTRVQARSMRRAPTDAERRMWWILRSLKPLGMHFRRQAPIGKYVADFAWHEGKLVVEIDGGQHAEAQHSYDERRTTWLESQGYRVIRFWNTEVLKAPRSVGEAVLLAASKNPTPNPSPPSGRLRPSSTGYGGGVRSGASGKDIAL
jgi:very-short-patch-repair endonuclease